MHVLGSGNRGGHWCVALLARCCVAMFACTSLSIAQGQQAGADASGGSAAVRPPASGEIHADASRVFIHVGKTGLGHEHAVVGKLKMGQMQLSQPNGAGLLVFDMTSFQADTEEARRALGFEGTTDASTQSQVNANMLGESVLDVQRYPTAVFKIASIQPLAERTAAGHYQFLLKGDFTLHGVTKPLQVTADMEPKDQWFHVRGKFDFLQSDYGITPFSKGFGVIGVADKLTVYANFWVAP